MGEAISELRNELDWRHTVAAEILGHMKKALGVYEKYRTESGGRYENVPEFVKNINIPRCSKEHLTHIVKELTEYTDELQRIRCELPRLLKNGEESDD